MVIEYRHFRPEDTDAVRRVHEQAFGGHTQEADLVERLHAAGKAVVTLVATTGDGRIVAHLLFSEVTLDPPDPRFRIVGLAPVGVLQEYQKRGIGSALIREGLTACRHAGYAAVVVLGSPAYYVRFGFRRAADHGLGNEYGADGAFQVLWLGEAGDCTGTVRYPPEFAAAGC